GEVLDEVIATYFAAPHSATGEDVAEIATHGAPVLLAAVVEAARGLGARLAEPGEFTRRAFLRGRLDLAQAEAVRDLIEAQTLFQARTAARQLGGSVAHTLRPVQTAFRRVIARLEAGIDFADDDVPLPDPALLDRELGDLERGLLAFAGTYHRGRIVREGLTLALVGRPNVGKSSLFNQLLGRERAIVTPEPGTTRDVITEAMDWDGIPVHLMDTAGLRSAQNEAERQGIDRAWQALADADLILAVADGSAPPQPQDLDLLRRMRDMPQADFVLNKSDLGTHPDWRPLAAGAHAVSARTGANLDVLRAAVRERIRPDTSAGEFLTQGRHAEHVAHAAECVQRARTALTAST
ncbi:MAG: tRNA modification GTPase, partial [Terriglobales bacterium]